MHLSQGYTYHLSIIQSACSLAKYLPVYLLVLDTREQITTLILREFNTITPLNLRVITISNRHFGLTSNTLWYRPKILKELYKIAENYKGVTCYTRNIKTAEFLLKNRNAHHHQNIRYVFECHQLFSINLALQEKFSEAKKESQKERIIYTNIDTVFTNTKPLSRLLKWRYGKESEVLPLAVDEQDIISPSVLNATQKEFDFVYAGSFDTWKGADTLILALTALKERGWEGRAMLVGIKANDIKFWSERIRDASLANSLVLIERQPKHCVKKLLDQAKIGVIPNSLQDDSIFGTSPLKLYDYAARGLNLVVSRVPALDSEIELPDVLWFKPDDPLSLASTLEVAISKFKGPSLGNHAWASKHSWDDRARDIIRRLQINIDAPIAETNEFHS